MVFILAETVAGYGLLKIDDKGAIKTVKKVENLFKDTEKAKKALNLCQFKPFSSLEDAHNASLLGEKPDDKLPKSLKSLLKTYIVKKEPKSILYLENPKLGTMINKKFKIKCKANTVALEVVRNIRQYLVEFLDELDGKERTIMKRGLAHHFSRYKLQFSAEKEDYMIIQAVKLLEDLDKWLNQLSMRLREWFGTNFPELQKIVNDNLLFAQIVYKAKTRVGCLTTDMSGFLEEALEKEVKDAAKYSMGTKIAEDDLQRVNNLAKFVIDYSEDRNRLVMYLKSRMETIAPNLTAVVGEKVGAKLIAHAGSLQSLAKCPASTLQIMGAEKALFRAMKARSSTPKYGHIYHASLVGSSNSKIRGKVARTLACKASLATRVDAFDTKNSDPELGMKLKRSVERRIEILTHGKSGHYKKPLIQEVSSTPTITKTKQFQEKSDVVVADTKKRKIVKVENTESAEPAKKAKKEKKKKKKRKIAEVEKVESSEPKKAKKEKKKKKKKKTKA